MNQLPKRETALDYGLDVVRELVVKGDVRGAHVELRAAASEIAALPSTPGAHELRARAKLERARLAWYAAGATARLSRALDLAEEAQRELGDTPSAPVSGDVAAVIAGIAHDLADPVSIERGRRALEGTLKSLLDDGATDEAATLVLAQAALDLRSGHAEAVTDGVGRSLDLLGRPANAATDSFAALHVAGTRHLLGRLPLHGAVGDASRDGALIVALRGCRLAEVTYAQHGYRRDLAGVLETTARLEALRGRSHEAHFLFDRAHAIADDIADIVGLARISAGIAALLTIGETADEALSKLATSISLNLAKGSKSGLACDETILLRIEENVAKKRKPHLGLDLRIAATRSQLGAAIASTDEAAP